MIKKYSKIKTQPKLIKPNIPTTKRYKPTAILRNFGKNKIKHPDIIANIADIVKIKLTI